MSSDDRVSLPDNVNYKTVGMHNGKYRLRKVPMNNIAGSSVTLTQTGTQLVEWKIPANTIFNPSRSCLEYQIASSALAANANYIFDDTAEIVQSIQFCNASGVYLTDLQYANNYVSVARKIDTSNDDFLSLDHRSGLHKSDASVPSTAGAVGLTVAQAATILATGGPVMGLSTNLFPPTATAGANNAYGAQATAVVTALTSNEPAYVRTAAQNTALTVYRSIPLAAFTGTALGMDRDMIFGEDVYIRIQVAPHTKIGFTATQPYDPVTGAAVLATAPTLTNFYLQLATQVDPVLCDSIRAKFLAGGMKYLIPFVYGWRNSTATGVASIQLTLNNGLGKVCKRLLHAAFNATEQVNTAYDHCNMAGAKISQYQTALDSVPLQDAQLVCAQTSMDDWRENRDLCRSSAIANSAAYYYNWFHCDSWSQPKRGKVLLPDSNILEGLDLSMPRSWTFTGTTAANLVHYTFGTFVREIGAYPQGTQVLVA